MFLKRKLSFTDSDGVGSKRSRQDQVHTLHEFNGNLYPSNLQLVQQLSPKYQINAPHSSSRKHIYQLKFRNKLPETLFTERKLRAENNKKVEIAIVDASNKVIEFGSMAMAKVEIVVLDGDFNGDKNGEWTKKEFEKHLMVPRKDKGPLLAGNLLIKLCKGFVCISDAKFTDNSSWIRSKKFRLGVKVLGGMAGEVVEGISNAFRVKDRHCEKYQKDRPPLMNDSVCCLKGIFKNGPLHKKLVEMNINTVWDFLCYSSIDTQDTLCVILGMGKGKWKKTYDHAMQSKRSFDIQLSAPLYLSPPDQVDESISPQISNVLLPSNDSQQLPYFAEYGQPIPVISTVPQNLPAINLSIESKSTFKTNLGSWKGTEHFETSLEVLIKGNGTSEVPNKFYIDSLSFRHIRLKLFFIVRLKFAARKHAYKNIEAMKRQFREDSPIFNYGNYVAMDPWTESIVGISDNESECFIDKGFNNDLWKL